MPVPPRHRIALVVAALGLSAVRGLGPGGAFADDPGTPQPPTPASTGQPVTPPPPPAAPQLVTPQAAPAAPEPAQPGSAPEEPVVVRVYNVRDLILAIPDFASPTGGLSDAGQGPGGRGGGGSGGGNQGLFSSNHPRPDAEAEGMASLVKAVQASVKPDSWREGGGSTGWVHAVGGALVVGNTAAVQQQVVDFLAGLRKAARTSIRVRAHWVLVDRADLEKALVPAAGPPPPPTAQDRAAGVAAPVAVGGRPSALLAASAADLARVPGVLADARGELTCMDGQEVWLSASTDRMRVDGVNEVGPSGGHYVPNLAVNTNGLSLELLGSLSEDGRSAVVTLRSQWTADAEPVPRTVTVTPPPPPPATRPASVPPPGPAGPRPSLAIELTNLRQNQLQTTLRVPTGRMVLVGGMAIDPARALIPGPAAGAKDGAKDTAAARAEAAQLYLFVEVTAD